VRMRLGALVWGLAILGVSGVAGAEGVLHVGTAATTVNPPEGAFLAGYTFNRTSTGVHDDLFAKAIVFDDGTARLALVVVDCIGLQYDTVCAIRETVGERVDLLPPERIVIQSTHTHCGPDVIGLWGPNILTTGRMPEYMASLVTMAAAQVIEAAVRLKPATAVYAQTECKGWAVNDSEPDVLDNAVTVLQFLDEHGQSIATLTHFACHPTVLDEKTTEVSADWVGAFCAAMADALPGEHLFLQGAVGCWIQPETPERTFALAETYGRDLAHKTLAALETPVALGDVKLRSARKVFGIPVAEKTPLRAFAKRGIIVRPIGETVETEAAWFALGPAQFATHPGESAPLFAEKTRALMDTGPKFVLGLGLDELGYICPAAYFDTPDAFAHGSYLISMSPGRDAGATLMRALADIIP